MIHVVVLRIRIRYLKQQMHVSVWMYIMHTLYLPQVTAIHVAIIREAQYKGYINANITYFLKNP